MTTEDLLVWLRAQLDEDERIARNDLGDSARDKGRTTGLGWPMPEGGRDSARVLREVAATRRILDEVIPKVESMERQIISEWGTPEFRYDRHGRAALRLREPYPSPADDLLRLLAAPYSDRLGYRQEWAPGSIERIPRNMSSLGAGFTLAIGQPSPEVTAVRDCTGTLWTRSDPSPSGPVGWYRDGIGVAKPWSIVARYAPVTDATGDA